VTKSLKIHYTIYLHCQYLTAVYLKTDGTTTGQKGASLPQLVAISSSWWREGADDGSTGQSDRWQQDK